MTSTVYRQTRDLKRIAYAFIGILCSLLLAPIAFAEESEQATAMSSTDEMRAVSGELGDRASLPGAALFATHCANCHNGQVYKAPHTTWLEMMPARSIYRSLDGGIMSAQSSMLSDEQKVHVVEYLLQERFTDADIAPSYAMCEGDAASFSAAVQDQQYRAREFGVSTRH